MREKERERDREREREREIERKKTNLLKDLVPFVSLSIGTKYGDIPGSISDITRVTSDRGIKTFPCTPSDLR